MGDKWSLNEPELKRSYPMRIFGLFAQLFGGGGFDGGFFF